jgi:hypothetical protein
MELLTILNGDALFGVESVDASGFNWVDNGAFGNVGDSMTI